MAEYVKIYFCFSQICRGIGWWPTHKQLRDNFKGVINGRLPKTFQYFVRIHWFYDFKHMSQLCILQYAQIWYIWRSIYMFDVCCILLEIFANWFYPYSSGLLHWHWGQCMIAPMGLLPDTENCRLCMRRECRERFPPPPISKETAS